MNRRRFLKSGALWVPPLFAIGRARGQALTLADPALLSRTIAQSSTPPASYLIEENCEGTGTPSGWTNSGSQNWDYTTTVLEGSESLYLAAAPASYYALSDASVIYAYCLFRIGTMVSAATSLFGFRTSADSATCLFRIGVDSGDRGKVSVFVNGADSTVTVAAMATNTLYHCWLKYEKSGTCYAAFSTDGTRPTTGDNFASRAGSTTAVGRLTLVSSIAAVMDKIRVDDTEIGDNPA